MTQNITSINIVAFISNLKHLYTLRILQPLFVDIGLFGEKYTRIRALDSARVYQT